MIIIRSITLPLLRNSADTTEITAVSDHHGTLLEESEEEDFDHSVEALQPSFNYKNNRTHP